MDKLKTGKVVNLDTFCTVHYLTILEGSKNKFWFDINVSSSKLSMLWIDVICITALYFHFISTAILKK